MNTLNDFHNYLKLNVTKPNSQNTYLGNVSRFFNFYSVFNQDTLNDYLVKKSETLKPASFNLVTASFRHYINFLKLNYELPKKKRQTKKVVKYLTKEDLFDNIFGYFDLIFRDANKRKLIAKIMFYTGLRLEEMCVLKRSNIDLTNCELEVIDSKGHADRIVPFPDFLGKDIAILFNTEEERISAFNINKDYIGYMCDKINEMIRYKVKVTPKIFRHSFAHYCEENGLDIRQISQLMGHKHISTTESYLTSDSRRAIDAYKKISKRKNF